MADSGLLVIADISGYTRFLTESELDHANEIISELLNAVTGAIHSPLTVSRIEGDAVFMYGVMPEAMSGQTVLESVELLYCSFAAALETMILNTTCRCNACSNINTLGMKIVMHCGEFAKSEIGGQETLSGPDVIIAHRLLKNHVVESTGIADYMLVTQGCVDDLGVQRIVAGWIEHTEEYEHVGEVRGHVSSLPDVWAYVREQNENKVLEHDAWLTVSAHSQAPLAVVWDHLIDPFKRTRWLMVRDTQLVGDQGGRIGAGTEYHCAHVEDGRIQIFTVLDMKTTDYVTFVTTMGPGVGMRYTDYLIPSGTGTRIVKNVAPLFSTETGEQLSDQGLAEMKGPVSERLHNVFDRLAEMSDHAAASLTSV
jgi:hypothetical protein